jgi:large subunit ribosomal protein L25
MPPIAHQLELVERLPPFLLRFFQKFPPRDSITRLSQPPVPVAAAENGKAPAWPNNRHVTSSHPLLDPSYNPFLPWLNPATGRWRPPMYSLRKQALICKTAKQYGLEELVPWSLKKSAVIEERKAKGSMVKGTGVGQRPKGHIQERHMAAKLEERKQAMLKMPEMIREWKLVSGQPRQLGTQLMRTEGSRQRVDQMATVDILQRINCWIVILNLHVIFWDY